MPSTTIQSRIHAFESLGSNGSSYPPSTSKINPQSSSSLLEEPISPTAKSFSPIVPSAPFRSSHSPSPSPPNLGRKTSLIDLRDWVVDDGPAKPSSGVPNSHLNTRRPPPRRSDPSERAEVTPLISLESPPKARSAPPLPPPKRLHGPTNGQTHASGEPSMPKRPDSLAVEHTYPPFLSLDTSSVRKGLGHAPASSISSFHSVSLSDGEITGTPSTASNFVFTHTVDGDGGDADSLGESFENVSALSSPVNFVSHDWDGRESTLVSTTNIPPKLPERPKPRPTPSPSNSPLSSPRRPNIPIGASSRRMPPPPPRHNQSRSPSARTSLASTTVSDRSSILSTATTATSRTSASLSTQFFKAPFQLYRPTPVPAAAKQRYESVFVATIRARRKTDKPVSVPGSDLLSPSGPTASAAVGRKVRKAAGWRGLSVDLITNPKENALDVNDTGNGSLESVGSNENEGPDDRLEGYTVRRIWNCSKLADQKLRDIWNDCDPDQIGSLDMDAFVKGMWRIDEELRRAQLVPPLNAGPSKRQPRSLAPR